VMPGIRRPVKFKYENQQLTIIFGSSIRKTLQVYVAVFLPLLSSLLGWG
jgi:hypothetical protein